MYSIPDVIISKLFFIILYFRVIKRNVILTQNQTANKYSTISRQKTKTKLKNSN